jgi:hypothetical protein
MFLMLDDHRLYGVRSIIANFVESPSLRHLRDPRFLTKVAKDVVAFVDRQQSVWQKWDGVREAFLKSASCCWVPVEDLCLFLNRLPGPTLTLVDVAQRLRAFHEEPYGERPHDAMRESCLAIYERELSVGTELAAIVGELQEHVEREHQRLFADAVEEGKRRIAEEKAQLNIRLRSGADCKWISPVKATEWFRRLNGRLYRLTQTNEKRWDLHRLGNLEEKTGMLLGTYRTRGEASKVVAQAAYQPEPRW